MFAITIETIVNNRNARTRCAICLKLTIMTPERRHERRSGVLIVNFEKVNADWVVRFGLDYFSDQHQFETKCILILFPL